MANLGTMHHGQDFSKLVELWHNGKCEFLVHTQMENVDLAHASFGAPLDTWMTVRSPLTRTVMTITQRERRKRGSALNCACSTRRRPGFQSPSFSRRLHAREIFKSRNSGPGYPPLTSLMGAASACMQRQPFDAGQRCRFN